MAEWLPEWRFAEMTPAQIAENPVQGEFFTSAADMPERLVREAIQNSMDAAQNDQVVRVHFTFSGSQFALDPDDAERYLDGLHEHLEAVAEHTDRASSESEVRESHAVYQAAQLLDEPLEWLVVEDFGTRGLTGDVMANGANEPGNNFWGFFRQIGISTKNEDAAGSWGLGKWVFPDASQINALIALTRRPAEAEALLMGLAILKTHESGGKRFPAYGHFAQASEEDDTEWFQMPVSEEEEPSFIEQTIQDFKLERGNKSGLSVIIPWPHEELTPASIARAVITQYFLPIMLGALEVVIEHPDEEVREISAEYIKDELHWIEESERDDESEQSLRGLIELTDWAFSNEHQPEFIDIPLPSSRSNPLRDEQSTLDIDDLRERYQLGERLAFRMRTQIQHLEDHAPRLDDCWAYIERAPELEHGHDYFVRGNLRIPNIDHLRSQKSRSLLYVDRESPLGHLLRDAEGPAHVDWDRNAARVKERWARGAGARIDDIRRAPLRLVQALVERPAERQMDALADLFPADAASPRRRSATDPIRGGGDTETDPPEPYPVQQSPVRLTQIQGGFSVSNRTGQSLTGSQWQVQFAYELARGGKNAAFRQFQRGAKDDCPDFSLHGDLTVDARGCNVQIGNENELRLEVTDSEFRLSVEGFDERDVIVELTKVDQDDAVEIGTSE